MAMARIQNHKGRCPKDIPTDPAKARRHLIQKYVTPSRFPPNTWPGRLRLVFGASMPKPLATCLVALARLRHEFAHRHNPPRPIDWMNGPDLSDVLNTLFLSAVALSNLLAAQARNR
jgi:hypothetical protein